MLGGGSRGGALCIAGIFVGGVVNRRSFPTSYSRSYWGVEFHRDLMFAASSGVIGRWYISLADS